MKTMMASAIALAAIAGLTGTALAQKAPPTPEQQAREAASTRHGLFHVIGAAFSPTGAMLRNVAPFDAAKANLSATRVEVLGGMIKDLTAADTSKLVPKSEAKPNIWTERADFEAKADSLVKAAGLLKAASASGDKDATIAAAKQVGGACKSCHDKFREEEHDH